LDIATNDTEAFQVGKDLATTEGSVVFENALMQLIQYHPRTETQHAIPIILIPAWINKFYILDMQPKNSVVRYLLDRGHSVFVVSWVNPTEEHAEMDFSDYMRLGPLAALDVVREITGEETANILGFCIGGILVTATLAYLAAQGDTRVNSATTLATMVDFEDVGDIGVFVDDHRLEVLREHMADKGYLEAHHLQDMFSMLRENDLIWTFFEANYLRGSKPRAFDLLYWNSDSTRLPAAMLLWYLKEVYLGNSLRKPGGLSMDGVAIDVSKITTPCFVLATEDDHIAPWRSVYPATQLFGGDVEFVLGGSGHIAGVINPPGERMKYGYRTASRYPATPETFLSKAREKPGSWWPHWGDWLEAKDGRKVPARRPARKGKYKVIEPAPGRYVLAR
ncbi:MAG: alpha/beta fold hydrolase, partial [Pseudomonadota bacterium]